MMASVDGVGPSSVVQREVIVNSERFDTLTRRGTIAALAGALSLVVPRIGQAKDEPECDKKTPCTVGRACIAGRCKYVGCYCRDSSSGKWCPEGFVCGVDNRCVTCKTRKWKGEHRRGGRVETKYSRKTGTFVNRCRYLRHSGRYYPVEYAEGCQPHTW